MSCQKHLVEIFITVLEKIKLLKQHYFTRLAKKPWESNHKRNFHHLLIIHPVKDNENFDFKTRCFSWGNICDFDPKHPDRKKLVEVRTKYAKSVKLLLTFWWWRFVKTIDSWCVNDTENNNYTKSSQLYTQSISDFKQNHPDIYQTFLEGKVYFIPMYSPIKSPRDLPERSRR